MACAWGGFAGYGVCMLLSYFVGQHYAPVKYPIKDIAIYTVLAAVLWGVSTIFKEQNIVLSPSLFPELLAHKGEDLIVTDGTTLLGADDKAGIALAMEMYEWYWDKISLLFTRQEETGCNWSRHFCDKNPELIKQCTYCLVLDRKNKWDIIWYQNWYCWKEFDEALWKFMKDWWYKSVVGWISDTWNIWKLINAVNLSIGYYNLHTSNEYLDVDEYVTAAYAIADVIEHFQWADYPLYVAPKTEIKTYNKYKATSRDKYGGNLFNRISIYEYFESVDEYTIKLKKDICLYNKSKTFMLTKWEYNLEDLDEYWDLGLYY